MKTNDKKTVIKNATSVMDGKENGLVIVMREHKDGIWLTKVGGCSSISVAMMLDDIVTETPELLGILAHLKAQNIVDSISAKQAKKKTKKVAPKKKK